MGREGLFQLTSLRSLSVSEVHQGMNARQASGGRNCKRKRGGMLPPGLLSASHSAASLTSLRTIAHEWCPLQWAGSYYINHESRKCPWVNLMESFSQRRSLFSDDPSCVKLAQSKTKPPHFRKVFHIS